MHRTRDQNVLMTLNLNDT